MEVEEVLQRISTNTRWVYFQFPDLRGNLKRKCVRASVISSMHFSQGLEAEEVNENFNEIYEEELFLVPIPDTYAKIPWLDATDRLICVIKKNKERYLKDCIYPLERAIKSSELAEKIAIKQKISFVITDGTSLSREEGRRSVDIPTKEADWNPLALRGKGNLALIQDPQDVYLSIRQQIADVMTDVFNYPVLYHFHEKNPSQQAITFDGFNPLAASHCMATLKTAAKTIAISNVAVASFMPMPFHDTFNDYELSFSMYEKGNNMFYDENDKEKLSQTARYFIGGILQHANALTFFTNPSTNSYKRLLNKTKFTSAGFKDKFNAVVIKSSQDFNIKLTFPDPSANPYLAIAAIIAAGIDGIKKKIEPVIVKESPIVMSEAARKKMGIKEVANSFNISLEAIENDNDFLNGIFSPELLYTYTEMRMNDYKDHENKPSDLDYFDYFHL
jgi:glutamine synthetase